MVPILNITFISNYFYDLVFVRGEAKIFVKHDSGVLYRCLLFNLNLWKGNYKLSFLHPWDNTLTSVCIRVELAQRCMGHRLVLIGGRSATIAIHSPADTSMFEYFWNMFLITPNNIVYSWNVINLPHNFLNWLNLHPNVCFWFYMLSWKLFVFLTDLG